jgi:hypothetical protein
VFVLELWGLSKYQLTVYFLLKMLIAAPANFHMNMLLHEYELSVTYIKINLSFELHTAPIPDSPVGTFLYSPFSIRRAMVEIKNAKFTGHQV